MLIYSYYVKLETYGRIETGVVGVPRPVPWCAAARARADLGTLLPTRFTLDEKSKIKGDKKKTGAQETKTGGAVGATTVAQRWGHPTDGWVHRIP